MATYINGTTPPTTLPGEEVAYVLEAGSGRAHVLLGQVGRALAGAEETGGAMSVMSLDGPRAERPIPLHYHEREYEFFFCFRGAIQLWADGESRVLHPGDFGYIPPTAVHAYQLLGHHSEFLGPVVPGGWDRFFDLTGEPYPGPAFPAGPPGPPPFEKFGRAEQEFKMKYRPDLEYAEAAQGQPDDTLPGSTSPYFLRAGEGPRHTLGGQLQTSLVTSAETAGTVAMTTVELPKGRELPAHLHERTYESLIVLEGRLRVRLDGDTYLLTRGDCASIPSGCEHAYAGDSHYTSVLTMSSPGGLERLFALAGEETGEHIFPAEDGTVDLDRVRQATSGLDIVLTDL